MNYNQLFHEDYTALVKKVDEKNNKLSIFKKLKKKWNIIFKKHIQISDYDFWTFSKLAYSNDGVLQEFINLHLKRKYDITDFINEEDGLQFYIISSILSNDIIIAFRGTDEWKDWLTNIKIMQKKGQFETAKLQLDALFIKYQDYHIYFCGHSLGGALAQEMFLNYKKNTKLNIQKAITFNSAGVRSKNDNQHKDFLIKNYIIDKDIVGCSTGYHYGESIYLKETINSKNLIKIYTHSLDQFAFDELGNVNNVKINDVKKQVNAL